MNDKEKDDALRVRARAGNVLLRALERDPSLHGVSADESFQLGLRVAVTHYMAIEDAARETIIVPHPARSSD